MTETYVSDWDIVDPCLVPWANYLCGCGHGLNGRLYQAGCALIDLPVLRRIGVERRREWPCDTMNDESAAWFGVAEQEESWRKGVLYN